MKRNIYISILIVITLIQVACKNDAGVDESKSLEEIGVCNCNDVFLDPEYSHFYTEKRDEPFTGPCESYFADGSIKVKKIYLNGRLEGPYLEYYENGVVKSEWNFLKGRQHGDYKGFYPDGNLEYHRTFHKGDHVSIVFP